MRIRKSTGNTSATSEFSPGNGGLLSARHTRAPTFVVWLVLLTLALGLTGCKWVSTWSASPQTMPGVLDGPNARAQRFNNQTVRMIARVSRGGEIARVRLDNTYGGMAVTIGAASIAKHHTDARIVDGTSMPLTFSGKTRVTLRAGESIRSDEVAIGIADLDEVVISLYLPRRTIGDSGHRLGQQKTYISKRGNFVDATNFPGSRTTTARYLLSDIEVQADDDTLGIVTIGASITDGYNSTVDANRRWPDRLADRLFRKMGRRDLTVINAGVSGNRVLNKGIGPSVLSRLDRDALDQPGAAFIVLSEGLNDIGFPEKGLQTVSANAIIQGYREIIARAHAKCVKVIGATLTPFRGAGYFTEAREDKRQALNAFMRNSGEFDGLIDFDAAVRDPQRPERLRRAYDSGDHLHPNDRGYKAMAQSVDTALFDKPFACAFDEAA